MNNVYNIAAPKKPTNLTVNSDLLLQAKALEINISAVLEQALAEQVKKLKAEAWVQENQEAIAAYNKDVEESGSFSDGLRSF
ncbi:MAG: type II toxin-antitoxin system CcdA family antitoxin [Thermaceae bacterium]|nr:type II toxin-antitoxin system CcdA family antitoxin [Thermaceae bacterium]